MNNLSPKQFRRISLAIFLLLGLPGLMHAQEGRELKIEQTVHTGGAPTPAQVNKAIASLTHRSTNGQIGAEARIKEYAVSKVVAASLGDLEVITTANSSPALTTPEFGSLTGDNDPQIAVGQTWLAVTGYNRVAFYKKGETTPTATGSGLVANPISTSQLFAWLISPTNPNNANTELASMGIPKSDCDPSGMGNTTQCITDIYDLRVRYDKVGGHFFILAHTRPTLPSGAPDSEKLKRRSFNFLAVTNSEDPHDGFHYFFWPEVVDQGICSVASQCHNTPYTPGQACDYPTFTVNDPYFVEADNVRGSNPYEILHVLPLSALRDASSTTEPKTTRLWNFKGAFNEVVDGSLRPVERLTNSGDRQYLARTMRDSDGNDGIEVFWFNTTSKPITLHSTFVKIDAFGSLSPASDPPTPTGEPLFYSNMGNQIVNAVVRNGHLWAVFDDCRKWQGESQCSVAIRAVEIDFTSAQPKLLKDRTFGKHSADDNQNDPIVSYGNPGVMVTSKGDAVFVFNRTSAKLNPEARYSVWLHNESDVRPSRVLQKGDASPAKTSPPTAVWNIDTAGVSIDPSDESTVWLAHDYGTNSGSPTIRMAIGMLKLP